MLRKILTPLAYLGLVAFIVGGTMLLVAFGRGYSYDIAHNRLVLNGLVIFGSTPSSATVYLNDKITRHKTPYRTTLESGQYNYSIVKQGFRTWQKRLNIVASEVTYAQYIFLFPNDLKTKTSYKSEPVVALVASPDHRRFAYVTAGKEPAVWLVGSDLKQGTKLYTPQAASVDGTTPAETITNVTFSDDASRVLVSSQVGAKNNYVVASTGSIPNPVNLTQTFGFDMTNVLFNPANARELYWLSPEGLRRLNVDDRSASAVLAPDVTAYTFSTDRVIFVQKTKLGKSLWSLDRAGKTQELVQSLAESDTYQLAFANYRGTDIVGVIPAVTRTLTIYTDVFSETLSSKVIGKDVTNLRFNQEGRFILFNGTQNYGTYDFDRHELVSAQAASPITAINWFDNAHVTMNLAGKVMVGEFDGGNVTALVDSQEGMAAFPTSDQKYLISLIPGSSGLQLGQSLLKP